MLVLTSLFIISGLLAALVSFIFFSVSKKNKCDFNKLSPFECGFGMKDMSRSTFSLHFFLVALVFIIFDIELVVLFPFIMKMEIIPFFSLFLFVMVMFLLTFGLIQEWKSGMLEWFS